jgi:hypothetical protein
MPVAPFCAFSATAASGTTAVSFDVGGAWDKYTLIIPAMASGTTLAFQVSDTADGTYYPLYHAPTIASAPVLVQIASGLTAVAVELPNSLGRFFKVERVATPTSTASTFNILCKGN